MTTTYKIAVTGLSRAGKTVFITSLVNNLLAAMHHESAMPKVGTKEFPFKILNTDVSPTIDGITAPFLYRENFDLMRKGQWPKQSNDIREISINLQTKSNGSWDPFHLFSSGEIRIDLVDYPGEWILDLPLLNETYPEWSGRIYAQMQRHPYRQYAARLLELIPTLDHDRTWDLQIAKGLHDAYRGYLHDCRQEGGIQTLEPGRFLCPGAWGTDLPFLWFAPLIIPTGAKIKASSYADLMSRRFETYKQQVRKDFIDPHFSKFDRQILLFDLLQAFGNGRECFEDLKRVIRNIVSAMPIGGSSWTSMFSHRIERVALCATKADCMRADQRHGMKSHLQHTINAHDLKIPETCISYHIISSVKCTKDHEEIVDGKRYEGVKGCGSADGKPELLCVNLPKTFPDDDYWRSALVYNINQFQPPIKEISTNSGIPNEGLDDVLISLLK